MKKINYKKNNVTNILLLSIFVILFLSGCDGDDIDLSEIKGLKCVDENTIVILSQNSHTNQPFNCVENIDGYYCICSDLIENSKCVQTQNGATCVNEMPEKTTNDASEENTYTISYECVTPPNPSDNSQLNDKMSNGKPENSEDDEEPCNDDEIKIMKDDQILCYEGETITCSDDLSDEEKTKTDSTTTYTCDGDKWTSSTSSTTSTSNEESDSCSNPITSPCACGETVISSEDIDANTYTGQCCVEGSLTDDCPAPELIGGEGQGGGERPACFEGEKDLECTLIDIEKYVNKLFTVDDPDVSIETTDINFCNEFGNFPTDFGSIDTEFLITNIFMRDDIDDECFVEVEMQDSIDGFKPKLFFSLKDIYQYIKTNDGNIIGITNIDPNDFNDAIEFEPNTFGYYYPKNDIDIQFVLDYIYELDKNIIVVLDENKYKSNTKNIDLYDLNFDDILIDDKSIKGYQTLSNPCSDWNTNRADLEDLYSNYRDEINDVDMIINFDNLECLESILENKDEERCIDECGSKSWHFDGQKCYLDEDCSESCVINECIQTNTKTIHIINYNFEEEEIQLEIGTTLIIENNDNDIHKIKIDNVNYDLKNDESISLLIDNLDSFEIVDREYLHMTLSVEVIDVTHDNNPMINCFEQCGINESFSDSTYCFFDDECSDLCEDIPVCYEVSKAKDVRFVDIAMFNINFDDNLATIRETITNQCEIAFNLNDEDISFVAIVNVDEYTSVEQIKQVNNELINCDYFSGILYSPWVSIKELNKDHDIKTIFKNLFQDANNQFS
jgi:hypothetical protein